MTTVSILLLCPLAGLTSACVSECRFLVSCVVGDDGSTLYSLFYFLER